MANFNVGGFLITEDPPSPTGIDAPAGDSAPVSLGSSQVSLFTPQSMQLTSADPGSNGLLIMGNNSNPNFNNSYNCFEVDQGEELNINLNLQETLPLFSINVTVYIAVENFDSNDQAYFKLRVNGHDLDSINLTGVSTTNYQPQTWQVDPKFLQGGENKLSIYNSKESHCPIWINQIDVTAEANTTIEASFYWKSVFITTADAGATISKSVAITNGVTTTDSEVFSFAETIGVSATVKGSVPTIGSVSATVNSSFTATQSISHSVAMTQSETDTTTIGVSNLTEEMTIQFWQLCLQFQCNGKSIEQLMGVDQVPGIVETRFPNSGSNPMINVVKGDLVTSE